MTQNPSTLKTSASATSTNSPSHEELTRIFNTALVSANQESTRDFSKEMAEIMSSPAFSAILGAVAALSTQREIEPRAAAEQIISTFQRLDGLWKTYLLQEGLGRIKPKSQ